MASPGWFFSTLAQVTATIAGFIIAFSGVLHQLERQRRESVTEELRDDILDFEEKYVPVIAAIRAVLQFTFPSIDSEEEQGELKIVEADHTNSHSAAFRVVDSLLTLEDLIDETGSYWRHKRDYLWTEQEFDILDENLAYMSSQIRSNSETDFLSELASISDVSSEEVWKSNVVYSDDLLTHDIREYMENKYPEDMVSRHNLDGTNMRSISFVLRDLSRDFQKLNMKKERSTVGYEPNMRPIFGAVGLLLVFGVFIPLWMLVSAPSTFPSITGKLLLSIQAILLISTIVLSGYLIVFLSDLMGIQLTQTTFQRTDYSNEEERQ